MISVSNLAIRQGAFALSGITFTVPSGQHGVLMGRTGSGKTTVVEAICGLRPVAGGRIELDGRDVTFLKPASRGVGYVPQDRALFATMTVRDNLGFALWIRRWPRRERAHRVAELADLLGIDHLLERKPAGLSGGEAQRVALGRALASNPPLLCLDEPLSSLDQDTRDEMGRLLRAVTERMGVTTLHVTHSRDEARKLADVMLELVDGSVVRVD